jgi:hypothetical protein
MQYLLIHPKTRDMCITTMGITDILFEEGWRTGAVEKVISNDVIYEYECKKYSLTEPPEALHEFQVKSYGSIRATLFDKSI